ncbi:hypothetical protein [Mycobacteroides abscessus]|uniref:hypothetical protein n=1 Tax=Mycobacteroides abscessus TaxID=36809 RepID=UPI00178103ED|nr:hypothetical protein [Mycobacteroides abscessus]MBE5461917.1 hypothetical protein [Mycobacteroides abscessus]QOF42698.1 hypothetical protein E3G69_001736 [Mycobacteroides abscessus]QOF47396.1 hypothetical protein E3G70_001734 [Mycobacteroides abscessus]
MADPDVTSLTSALSELHFQAGKPSFRSIGRAVGCSHTTISKVFTPGALPSWEVLGLVIRHLDGDENQFRQLWYQAARANQPASTSDRDTALADVATTEAVSPVSTTRFAVLCAGTGALLLVLMMVQGAHPNATAANAWITDVSQVVFGALAALGYVITAVRSMERERLWRMLMAVGVAGWTAGHIAWTWSREVSAIDIPFPGPADAGYLILPVAAIPAIWILLGELASRNPPSQPGELRRIPVEAAIVAVAFLGMFWFLIPALAAPVRRLDGLSITVSAAYVLTDAFMLAMSVLAWGPVRLNIRMLFLSAGLAALMLSDSFFAAALFSGNARIPFGSDFGFIAAPALLFLAAYAPRIDLDTSGRSQSHWPRIRTAVSSLTALGGVTGYLAAVSFQYPATLGVPLLAYVTLTLILVLLLSLDRLIPV